MHGFIALYLIACLDPPITTPASLPVTTAPKLARRSEMSMMGCMGVEGANSAKKFWEDRPVSTRRITSAVGPAKSESEGSR